MTIIQKFIIEVIVIFSYSFCHAQLAAFSPSQAPYAFKSISNSVSYIFEGHVVQMQEKETAMSDRGNELVCCVVQITKIYKGSPQLKLGTIKVLSGYFQSRGENPTAVFDDPPPLTGGKHIIFGNLSNSKAFDSIATDNSFTLWVEDNIDFYGTTAMWLNIKFPTVDSLYSFFKNNGLEVQEEVQPAADSVRQK